MGLLVARGRGEDCRIGFEPFFPRTVNGTLLDIVMIPKHLWLRKLLDDVVGGEAENLPAVFLSIFPPGIEYEVRDLPGIYVLLYREGDENRPFLPSRPGPASKEDMDWYRQTFKSSSKLPRHSEVTRLRVDESAQAKESASALRKAAVELHRILGGRAPIGAGHFRHEPELCVYDLIINYAVCRDECFGCRYHRKE